MFADLKYEDNITLFFAVYLISLSLNWDLTSIKASFNDIDFKKFCFGNKFVSTADRANVFENLTFSFAFSARLLHLHLHRTHLNHLESLSTSVTLWTGLLFATLSASSMACIAVNVSPDVLFLLSASVAFK
jgi:hypothetical protein